MVVSGSSTNRTMSMLAGFAMQTFQGRVEVMCNKFFDDIFTEVDHDGSGTLDATELHIAILLLYSKFSGKLRGLALPPPSKKEVQAMCKAADADGNGTLDKKEFKKVFMRKFLHGIILRVAAHMVVEKLAVPAGVVIGDIVGQRVLRRLHLFQSGITGKLSAFMPVFYFYITRKVFRNLELEEQLSDAMGANVATEYRLSEKGAPQAGFGSIILNISMVWILTFWAYVRRLQRSYEEKRKKTNMIASQKNSLENADTAPSNSARSNSVQ